MHPATEYANLKDEIAYLEQRAQALRARLLTAPDMRRSNSATIVVRAQQRRIFRHDALPPDILNDPAYWDLRVSQVITVKRAEDDEAAEGEDPILIEAG